MDGNELRLIEPRTVLAEVADYVRRLRQRDGLTQGELARKAGVPATTISRLERTGLASTLVLFKILFAQDQIDAWEAYVKERLRLAAFPKSLSAADERPRKVLRVRHRKEATCA